MRISDWSSDVCSSAPSASRRPDADAAIDVPMTAVAQREVIIVERGNTVRLPDNLAEYFTSHMLAAGSVNLHAVAGGSGPALLLIGGRSEERRVGKEGVSTGRSRVLPDH